MANKKTKLSLKRGRPGRPQNLKPTPWQKAGRPQGERKESKDESRRHNGKKQEHLGDRKCKPGNDIRTPKTGGSTQVRGHIGDRVGSQGRGPLNSNVGFPGNSKSHFANGGHGFAEEIRTRRHRKIAKQKKRRDQPTAGKIKPSAQEYMNQNQGETGKTEGGRKMSKGIDGHREFIEQLPQRQK